MCNSLRPPMNQLISGLPQDARQRWLPQLERVELPRGLALHESGSQMSHAFFPTTAVVSLVYETAEGGAMELAVVGNEGFVGVELLLGGGSTPSRAVVQMAGEALRLPAPTLKGEIAPGGAAANLMLRYTMALIAQVAQAGVCNRHHSLAQRLSRWLLMRVDRTPGNEVEATQEQIAHLLGVRREGVTAGTHRLQRLGLISCTRGHIRVLDREGLETQCCQCYEVIKSEYERLLHEGASASRSRTTPAAAGPSLPGAQPCTDSPPP